jgi:hypothetical protein
MNKFITIILISLVNFTSCERQCVNQNVNAVFIGFSPAEIDNFVLRAYVPNDNYLHLIDSFKVSKLGASIYSSSGDSTFVYVNNSNPNTNVISNFDWKIYIPAVNKTVSISNIISSQTENKGRVCFNPIVSFVQDGQLVVPQYIKSAQYYTSGYFAYIHK